MSALVESLIELRDPREAAREVVSLNNALARYSEIPPELADTVDEISRAVTARWETWADVAPELSALGLTAVIDAERAIRNGEEDSRDELRSALARLTDALYGIAEAQPAGPSRSPGELAIWLTDTLDVPQRELAHLVDVPLRRFQRWVSPRQATEPEGVEADRLRVVAALVNQLRFSLTPRGVLLWLNSPHKQLGKKSPRDTIVTSPLEQPRLMELARSLRDSGGS
jgi:hypothetical protein